MYNALDLKPFIRYLCYIKCKRTCLLACHLLFLFKRCISNERFVICKDHLSHLYSWANQCICFLSAEWRQKNFCNKYVWFKWTSFFQFSICNKVVWYKKNIAELVTWKIINMSAHNELIALPSCTNTKSVTTRLHCPHVCYLVTLNMRKKVQSIRQLTDLLWHVDIGGYYYETTLSWHIYTFLVNVNQIYVNSHPFDTNHNQIF